MKKRYFFVLYLIVILQALCPFFLLLFRTKIIDFALNKNIDTLIYLGIYLGVSLFNIIISLTQNYILGKMNIIIDEEYDKAYISKLSRIQLLELESKNGRYITNEAEKCKELKNESIKNKLAIFSVLMQLISYLVYYGLINMYILISIVALLCIGIIVNIILSKKTQNFWPRYIARMRLANYYSKVLTSKEYTGEKKIYDYTDYFNNKYQNEFKDAAKENTKFGRNRFVLELLQEIVSIVFIICISVLMIHLVLKKSLTIGTFISIFLSLNTLYSLVLLLCSNIFDLRKNNNGLKKWQEFLNLKEYSYSGKTITNVNEIKISHLYFKYPNTSNYVIKDLSFTFDLNKHYALVGENGCGKSTLVKLILGLYIPNDGTIEIDGINIKEFSRSALNEIFSAVFQRFYAFPLSVGELITLDKKVEEHELNDVLVKLDLYDELNKLPEGINTSLFLENGGTNFSGGQLQKMAIARALLKDSKMVILDEPNSALDPISEVNIYRLYQTYFNDKCSLLITHRLGAVKDVDVILVMKDGQIIDADSHNNLLKNCNYYYELFTMQRELYNEKKN